MWAIPYHHHYPRRRHNRWLHHRLYHGDEQSFFSFYCFLFFVSFRFHSASCNGSRAGARGARHAHLSDRSSGEIAGSSSREWEGTQRCFRRRRSAFLAGSTRSSRRSLGRLTCAAVVMLAVSALVCDSPSVPRPCATGISLFFLLGRTRRWKAAAAAVSLPGAGPGRSFLRIPSSESGARARPAITAQETPGNEPERELKHASSSASSTRTLAC